jgi:hypothetical protein
MSDEIPDLEFTVYALKLVDYQLSGWHIFDLHYSGRCQCCGESSIITKQNVTGTEVETERDKFLQHGSVEKCVDILAGSLDSFIRFQDDKVGAYSPEGDFVPYPVSNIEVFGDMVERETELTRRQSQSLKLSMWFVREILHSYDENRVWQQTDFSGQIMKNAADLLKRYDADTIAGCLEANRDGLIGDNFELKFMIGIEKLGEPSIIQQWFDYCKNPPAIYLQHDYEVWEERRNKHYPELEAEPAAPKSPRKPKRKKVKQGELEL